MKIIETILSFAWIDLSTSNIITSIFLVSILVLKFNFNYRIRRLFGFSQFRPIKILDCSPCLSFWLSLAITGNIIIAMSAFLFISISQK